MKRTRSNLRTLLEPAVIAMVAALAIRLFVHGYSIPSDSMSPALAVGDHILGTTFLFPGSSPSRGDVVVFRLPDSDTRFVKRIVGMPGDLLEIRQEHVLINGELLREPYLATLVDNGAYPATLLAADQYFLMGDNRQGSIDSRAWGPVAGEMFEARARLIFWSSGDGQSIWSARAASGGQASPHHGRALGRIGLIR